MMTVDHVVAIQLFANETLPRIEAIFDAERGAGSNGTGSSTQRLWITLMADNLLPSIRRGDAGYRIYW